MKTRSVITVLGLAAALASCSDTDTLCPGCKPCVPPAKGQQVAYDWQLDPSASPQGMRLWLYPRDWAGDPMPLDLPGRDGGEIRVDAGRYDIISYNNDTEWITVSGHDTFLGHTLSTPASELLEPLTRGHMARVPSLAPEAGQQVAACPEPVWAAAGAETDVPESGLVTLRPVPLHCHYTYVFEDVGPLDHVLAASASISDMASQVQAATAQAGGDFCTLPLAATIDRDNDCIRGEFYTFGVPADSDPDNRMGLYVLMDDGKGYKFTEGDNLDVTAQIASAPDRREVHIVVRGVQIPDNTQAETGDFSVNVDDWGDDIIHDIPI